MKSCEEIVGRCLTGGEISRQNVTGTVMRAYLVSPYACFCQFHVDPKLKDPATRFGDLLRKWGLDLEEGYVDKLDPTARKKQFSYDRGGFEGFVKAAIADEQYIYNPPLFYLRENLAGKPDLLIREDSASSEFGHHYYRIAEIKFSSGFEQKDKRRYLLQGVLYNYLLGQIQGYLPRRFTMVDRHGVEAHFQFDVYSAELSQALREIENIRSALSKPEPVYGSCSEAFWGDYCDAQAEGARDISLVPHLRDHRIRDQMVAKGVRTVDQLAQLGVDEIGKFKWVGKRAEVFSQQAKSLAACKEIVSLRVTLPSGKDAEVYLDVEDTGYVHPSISHFVFLIGVAVRKDGAPAYHSFVITS